jgi:hypothetical protein
MDVWRMQYELQQNPRVPIRPTTVKGMLKQKKMVTVQVENETFVDRGIGTMVDCVDEDSLREIGDRFMAQDNEVGLKHRADNLLSIALCSRGDNMRSSKLSTIGLICFESEGVRGAKLYIVPAS